MAQCSLTQTHGEPRCMEPKSSGLTDCQEADVVRPGFGQCSFLFNRKGSSQMLARRSSSSSRPLPMRFPWSNASVAPVQHYWEEDEPTAWVDDDCASDEEFDAFEVDDEGFERFMFNKALASANSDYDENPEFDEEEQIALGPQSLRGGIAKLVLHGFDDNKHAQAVLKGFMDDEANHCGEFVTFYHSYSHSAMLYELQAAIAAVHLDFDSQASSLPRMLLRPFKDIPNAATLRSQWKEQFRCREDNSVFQSVAIAAICSLASSGRDCPSLTDIFNKSYKRVDAPLDKAMNELLHAVCCSSNSRKQLWTSMLEIAEKYGLDTSQYGGARCKSGLQGHIMQIFVHRKAVDRLGYAAKAGGWLDNERTPVSDWLNSDDNFTTGQVRLVAHPSDFLDPQIVRMKLGSADPEFHAKRHAFQTELCALVKETTEQNLVAKRVKGD